MAFQTQYIVIPVFASLALASGSACIIGLEKRDDAVEAESQTVNRKLRGPEHQSSVSRNSGTATLVRLQTIFPTSGTVLPAADFGFEGATGLNRAFGLGSRPYESLAQMALRGKVTQLCEQYVDHANTQLFALLANNQLLRNEVAPTDPIEALALGAARNAWLHPYRVSDPEVQELMAVYRKVKDDTTSEGGVRNGKKAVCITALLAPQFWLGAPESTDAAKRVSVEFFRRIPTMQELKDFADKKITIDGYFDLLLANPAVKPGFQATIHQWHEEWLGFRDFIDNTLPYADRRQSMLEIAGGASDAMARTYTWDSSRSIGGTQVLMPGRLASQRAGECLSNNAQTFDPDSNMIGWEHYNHERERFEFVGGFIRTGLAFAETDTDALRMSVADVNDALKKMADPGTPNITETNDAIRTAIIKDLCRDSNGLTKDQAEDVTEPGGTAKGVTWRRCNGLLSLGTTSALRIEDAMRGLFAMSVTWYGYGIETVSTNYPYNYWCKNKVGAELATCMTNHRAYAMSHRNRIVSDIHQLAARLKTYDASGTVPHAFHTRIAAIRALSTDDNVDLFDARAEFTDASGFIDQLTDTIAAAAGAATWYYETNLSEMKNPLTAGDRYYYNTGGFDRFSSYITDYGGGPAAAAFLPIHKPNLYGWDSLNRRVRRYGPSAGGNWQDGFSPIRLWYTGGTVSTCNNFDRFWATCFYRPANHPVGNVDMASFNPVNANIWSRFYVWYPESAQHPRVATGFYCGLPDSSVIATHAAGSANTAYQAVKFTQLNDVAVNVDFQGSASIPAGTALGKEAQVFAEMYTQLREEPYKLIEKLILTKDDYRKLLTADYAIGNDCLEFFYDTQGYYLPRHPRAAGQLCTGPGSTDREFKTTSGIPIGHLTARLGAVQSSVAARDNMWKKLHGGGPPAELPARVHSGILTMPAFVAPVASKARGVAARYFVRLLCDQPTFYDPAKAAVDAAQKTTLHRSFISHRKHLLDACFQCHRNLDPLSSALSWTFQNLLVGKECATAHGALACLVDPTKPNNKDGETVNSLGGEGSAYDFLGEFDSVRMKDARPFVGLRHGGGVPSRGAYMGQEVLGLRDLGQKVADSERFARCVSETTFEFVFGRKVQFTDLTFFNQLVKSWTTGDAASSREPYRYLDLIKLMITSENYQRKN